MPTTKLSRFIPTTLILFFLKKIVKILSISHIIIHTYDINLISGGGGGGLNVPAAPPSSEQDVGAGSILGRVQVSPQDGEAIERVRAISTTLLIPKLGDFAILM